MSDTNEQIAAVTNPNAELIAGLRAAADFLDQHPTFPAMWRWPVQLMTSVTSKDDLVSTIRASGGKWEKKFSEKLLTMKRAFGGLVSVEICVMRDVVCEARKVKKIIPAKPELVLPAQPEQEIEVIEWDCPDSILSLEAV